MWALSIQAFVCRAWGGGGSGGGVYPRRGTSRNSCLSKGTWESKCGAYHFNHKGLKITIWKVSDQDVYIFNLSTGIERAHGKANAKATFSFHSFTWSWNVSLVAQGFHMVIVCCKMKEGWENYPKEEKIRKTKPMRGKTALGKGEVVWGGLLWEDKKIKLGLNLNKNV